MVRTWVYDCHGDRSGPSLTTNNKCRDWQTHTCTNQILIMVEPSRNLFLVLNSPSHRLIFKTHIMLNHVYTNICFQQLHIICFEIGWLGLAILGWSTPPFWGLGCFWVRLLQWKVVKVKLDLLIIMKNPLHFLSHILCVVLILETRTILPSLKISEGWEF